MIGRPSAFGLIAGLALIALVSACGDSESSSETGGREDFGEGEVSVAVDMIDSGLVKGNATAEAKEGWIVSDLAVTAVEPNGTGWRVLEFREGLGSRSASEFFEVVLQELPRGQQLTITATVTFEGENGTPVKRAAIDYWPP
jgi:hypothetical protein